MIVHRNKMGGLFLVGTKKYRINTFFVEFRKENAGNHRMTLEDIFTKTYKQIVGK